MLISDALNRESLGKIEPHSPISIGVFIVTHKA